MNNRRIAISRPSQIFDSFLDEFFNTPVWSGDNMRFDSINVNVKDLENEVVVEAKVPGFSKDELDVKVENDALVIEGKKDEEKTKGNEDEKYYMREYSSQSVRRVIGLPSRVDDEKADAEVKDGILKVRLPKLADSQSKRISVK